MGVGAHEGDWEFVQVGCADPDGQRPILMTASQHQTGGKREFWMVEKTDEGRPVIYVARDSHANYFNPGIMGVEDETNGKGRIVENYEIRDFGVWADYEGRWGNSKGKGKSPLSPGQQGNRWHRPHAYHSSAR